MRRRLGFALALALGAAVPAGAAGPAAGGPPLLESAESTPLVVVGVVRAPERIDLHGRAAWLEIERTLAGARAPGERVRIAWEELAQGRPDRFAEGDRVLVALGPLPSGSLWRQRFPATPAAPPVLAVAASGDAFLRQPGDATIEALGRYLALSPEDRAAAPGAEALARLVSTADPVTAVAAVRRLATIPGVGAKLGTSGIALLAGTLTDPGRPLPVRAAVVGLAGEQRLTALRPRLEALATPGGELTPDALAALASLDGGLAGDRAEALLASDDPRVRAVAVRSLTGSGAEPRLAALLKNDPAAEVRAAAVTALLARGGPGVVADASPGLFDRDPVVKRAAAEGLGRLGGQAVPTLQQLAMSRGAEDAKGPLAALSLAGASGTDALREIATSHPDAAVRQLAMFALGHVPSHDRGGADLDPGSGPAAPPAAPVREPAPEP